MPENNYLTIDQSCQYLKIPKKYLENYAKVGQEIRVQKIGRRNVIDKGDLDLWNTQRCFGLVTLDKTDYLKCLDFAIRSFYSYSSTSDFGTSQQRDAGKFVSNFVSGKLGEMSVAKFLKHHFDVDVSLDFNLRDAVVGQDIVEIAKPRRGARVYNPLRKRVAVKTSKMKNVWLIVSQNEVEDVARCSDIYIYTRVDLYLNHFIRILKEHSALSNLSSIIPDFKDIQAEVCGFIDRDTLKSKPPVDKLPVQNQEIQLSYLMRSGQLKKTMGSWQKLIEEL